MVCIIHTNLTCVPPRTKGLDFPCEVQWEVVSPGNVPWPAQQIRIYVNYVANTMYVRNHTSRIEELYLWANNLSINTPPHSPPLTSTPGWHSLRTRCHNRRLLSASPIHCEPCRGACTSYLWSSFLRLGLRLIGSRLYSNTVGEFITNQFLRHVQMVFSEFFSDISLQA